MIENCAKIDDLELDFDKTTPKTAKTRQKPREIADSAQIRSAMSLETGMSYAAHRPANLPAGVLQLFLTSGDLDFIDALRAILTSANLQLNVAGQSSFTFAIAGDAARAALETAFTSFACDAAHDLAVAQISLDL